MKINHIIAISILSLAIVFSGLLSRVNSKVEAQSPFIVGGFITATFFCPCSGNFLLTVSPPIPGQFSWYPGTPQFPFFRLPGPAVWLLGLYEPGGICLVPSGDGCHPVGAPIGTITPIVGTSL